MVVGNEAFRVFNELAYRPPSIPAVHVVDEHLQVFFRPCRQGKLQSPVYGIAELPYLGFGLIALHRNRIVEISAVSHFETLGAFERIAFALIGTICTDGQLYMLRQRIT